MEQGKRSKAAKAKAAKSKFPCSHCPKTYSQKYQLNAHEHGHLGITPYSCSFCDKSMTHESGHATHERTHLKNKVFGKESQLHFKNKPFYCEHCAITYKPKSFLEKEERILWSIVLCSCSYCGKTSTKKVDVKKTKKHVDLNIRAYCCTDCKKILKKKIETV